jgi:hypothetical protein
MFLPQETSNRQRDRLPALLLQLLLAGFDHPSSASRASSTGSPFRVASRKSEA